MDIFIFDALIKHHLGIRQQKSEQDK